MRKKVCKLIFLLVCCLVFLPLFACSNPLAVESRPAQTQPAQTKTPVEPYTQTEAPSEPHTSTHTPGVSTVSWSILIDGAAQTNSQLEDSLDTIDMQVGCSQTTGYTLYDLAGVYSAGIGGSGLNVIFADGSSLKLDTGALSEDGTLLITEKDGELLEKPLLGFAAVIFPSPVAEIQILS